MASQVTYSEEVKAIIRDTEVAPQFYEFPADVFDKKYAMESSHTGVQEMILEEGMDNASVIDLDLDLDLDPDAGTDLPMDPGTVDITVDPEEISDKTHDPDLLLSAIGPDFQGNEDPVAPIFLQTLFSSDDLITPENTNNGSISKGQHAFNLLGCIVYMARFPVTEEGWAPVFKVYGYNLNIVQQLSSYVKDGKNGVEHNVAERSVTIQRAPLYALIKGGDDIMDENDRILTHFGNTKGTTSNITAHNIRKYFSGLKTAWDNNVKKGGNTYLNTFDYKVIGPRKCEFKFYY